MSDAGKAIFLSYASQDAEAAKRLCDALRSAGVEVWFDAEGGLEHGDEWDAKIRRQIKECVLFIPLISANTQAREEGYFRIEWDLAAERARGIASGVAFILPVVVDDTREPDALVPDRFRTVQWTRLKGGEVPPEVLQRFVKLWSHRTGVLKQQARGTAAPVDAPGTTVPVGRRGWWIYAALAAAVVVAAAGARWWLRHDAAPAGPLAAALPKPAESEARRLARAALDLGATSEGITRERLEAADEMCRRALALDALDPVVLALAARVDAIWVFYQFDTSETRKQQAASRSQQAAVLAPTDPVVRLARAEVYARVIATPPMQAEAERILRELTTVTEVAGGAKLNLGILLRDSDRQLEAAALYEEVGDLPSAGWAYWAAGRLDDAERVIDRQLQRGPSPNALVQKVLVALAGREDLEAANAAFAQFKPQELQQDGPVSFGLQLLQARREPNRLLDLANGFPREMLTSPGYFAPKRYHTGWAHQLAGRPELARQEWQSALASVQEARRNRKEDLHLLLWQVRLQGLLGLGAETDASLRLARSLAPPAMRPWLAVLELEASVALGRPPRSLETLGFAEASPSDKHQIHAWLRFSPEFDALRGEPYFQKFLRDNLPPGAKPLDSAQGRPLEEQKQTTVPAADDKSLVVLPLENLSPDPENAYFAEGMHAELIDALAGIPDLRVISRVSAQALKGSALSLAEIARKVGVANVMTGSVRRAGDRLRVQLELRRASDEAVLWSAPRVDREVKEVWALQSEIAAEVARALQAREQRGTNAAAQFLTRNPKAYELFVNLRRDYDRARVIDRAMVARIEEIVQLDPQFSLAVGLLSAAKIRVRQGTPETAAKSLLAREAKKWADEAAVLAPDGAGEGALSYYYFTVAQDHARALFHARRLIRALPNDATGHNFAGLALTGLGQWAEARRAFDQAIRLDPLNPLMLGNRMRLLARLRDRPAYDRARKELIEATSRTFSADAEQAYGWDGVLPAMNDLPAGEEGRIWRWRARRFAELESTCARQLEDPALTEESRCDILLWRARALRRLGQDQAVLEAARLAGLAAGRFAATEDADSVDRNSIRRAQAMILQGQPDDGLAIIRRLAEEARGAGQVSRMLTLQAILAEELAATDRAKECLELLARLLREPTGRAITVPALRVSPDWDRVREDPAFQALLADPKNTAPLQ